MNAEMVLLKNKVDMMEQNQRLATQITAKPSFSAQLEQQ